MNTTEYLVRSGDTLHSIAWRHNITVDVLSSLNRLNHGDINRIYVGQSLKVPKFGQYAPGTFSQFLTLRVHASESSSTAKYQHGMGDKSAPVFLLGTVSTTEEQTPPVKQNERSWVFGSYNIAEYKYSEYIARPSKHKNKRKTAEDLHGKNPRANEKYFDFFPIGKGKNTRAEDIAKRIKGSNSDIVAVQEASGSEDKSRKVIAKSDHKHKISQRRDLDLLLGKYNYKPVKYTAPENSAKASHIYYNHTILTPILIGAIPGKELVGLVNPDYPDEYSKDLGKGAKHKDKAYPWAVFESTQNSDYPIMAQETVLKQSLKELLTPSLLSPDQLTNLEQCLTLPDQLIPEQLVPGERAANLDYISNLKQQLTNLKLQNPSSRYIIVSSVHSIVNRKYKHEKNADLHNGRAALGLAIYLTSISNRDNSILKTLTSTKLPGGYPLYPMGIPIVIMGDMNSHYTQNSAPQMLQNAKFKDARVIDGHLVKDEKEPPKPSQKVLHIQEDLAKHKAKLSLLQEDPKKNAKQIETEKERIQKIDTKDYKKYKDRDDVKRFYKKLKPFSTFTSGRVIDYIFYHYTAGAVSPDKFHTFNKDKGKYEDKYQASDHRMISIRLKFAPK